MLKYPLVVLRGLAPPSVQEPQETETAIFLTTPGDGALLQVEEGEKLH